MIKYRIISTTSPSEKTIGYGYILDGIISFDYQKILSVLVLQKKDKFLSNSIADGKSIRVAKVLKYSGIGMSVITGSFNLVLLMLTKYSNVGKIKNKKNIKYILMTSGIEPINIMLIRKYNILNYYMVDGIVDYYGDRSGIRKFAGTFMAYVIECMVIVSGIKNIILNSEYVKRRFQKRHNRLLKAFNVNISVLQIGHDLVNSPLNINIQGADLFTPYGLIYGNFDFVENMDGLVALSKSFDIEHAFINNANLVIAGKNVINISREYINKFEKYFPSVHIVDNPENIHIFIEKAEYIIIPSTNCNGPKIKILECIMMNKTVYASGNCTKFFPKYFTNLISCKNNLLDIPYLLDKKMHQNNVNDDMATLRDSWSYKTRYLEFIDLLV
jgi:hypothetical protein